MPDTKIHRALDPEDYHPDFYKAILDLAGHNEYILSHFKRYMITLKHMPTREQFGEGPIRVLELATTDVFPYILRKLFRYEEIEVSCFDPSLDKEFEKSLWEADKYGKIRAFNIDLESELIPRADEYYDMVLCFEIIEHLERDPMFMVSEINRVLKPAGLLYLTTPNICSSRNVHKILEGYAPHFHMKYNRDRSLYRHNIEYAPHQIMEMMLAGGFKMRKSFTADTFEPPSEKAMMLLSKWGFPTDMRGDNYFGIFEKISSVVDRWPAGIYAS